MTTKIGYDDRPAPVIEQVRDIDGKGKRTITRERRYSTIEWLYKHRLLTTEQFKAAARLQEAAEVADIAPQPLSGMGGRPRFGVLSDAQLDAMSAQVDAARDVRGALDKLGSSGERLVRLVVIDNKTLGRAAAEMREPERGIIVAVRVALDVLVNHYALA